MKAAVDTPLRRKWLTGARGFTAAPADLVPAAGDFDWVFAPRVLHRVEDPFGVLLGWAAVLRPGGLVYAVVPRAGATPETAGHRLSTYEDVLGDYHGTVDVFDEWPLPRGAHFFTYWSFRKIVHQFDRYLRTWRHNRRVPLPSFEFADGLSVDDGEPDCFVAVYRVDKP